MPVSPTQPFEPIRDVMTVALNAFGDERGRFMETFRVEWFPGVNWDRLQNNRSDSKAGVLRGLHYHFKQVDYWYATRGRIRVGLVDLRLSSPTYLASATIDIGEDNPLGIFIPEGVAHGFAALTDCTLMYIVNNYYDGGGDEYGIAWDDPQVGIDWGVKEPHLSIRDRNNPLIANLPGDAQPQ
ncbi:MAG: dTDP-4-dehydrorhamnose 3,5-epimerase [Chloroflexi bacterium]|nr:dTDP-4-dehydrorhamnose 3,5-epimerase [Chloroflexota bacterium]